MICGEMKMTPRKMEMLKKQWHAQYQKWRRLNHDLDQEADQDIENNQDEVEAQISVLQGLGVVVEAIEIERRENLEVNHGQDQNTVKAEDTPVLPEADLGQGRDQGHLARTEVKDLDPVARAAAVDQDLGREDLVEGEIGQGIEGGSKSMQTTILNK